MPSTLQADAAIVGAGQAGPALAMALAQHGQQVVLVEGRRLGGTCVNDGCTPTKTLRKSARVAHLARRAAQFGVHVGAVEVDFAAAMDRMQDRVEKARGGLESWIAGEPRVKLVHAYARFEGRAGDRFLLSAGGQGIAATRVFLNVGTHPTAPPIPGLDGVPFLDNESLLKLRERPAHLVVLGGSYIGLEFAQIFRRLGSEVTVVEAAPRITAREDEDVSGCVGAILEQEGIRVLAGQRIERVERDGAGVALVLGSGRVITGSHLLVAAGRAPNTRELNLEAIGLKADERGFLPVNGRLETAVSGVWALGDANGRGAFTHTSYQDFEIVLANLDGGSRTADGRVPTYAMFVDPPLGRVGLNEREALASGTPHLVARFAMKDVSRAKEESETDGLVKILVDAQTQRIVGASIVGVNADEVIQVISVFMATGQPWQVLAQALPIHPTVTEFFPTILGKLQPLTGSTGAEDAVSGR